MQCNWKPLEHRQLGSADWVLGARRSTLGTLCSSIGFDWRSYSYSFCLVCVVATVWATFNFSFHFSSWSASHVNGCKITELTKSPRVKIPIGIEIRDEIKSSRVESTQQVTVFRFRISVSGILPQIVLNCVLAHQICCS